VTCQSILLSEGGGIVVSPAYDVLSGTGCCVCKGGGEQKEGDVPVSKVGDGLRGSPCMEGLGEGKAGR